MLNKHHLLKQQKFSGKFFLLYLLCIVSLRADTLLAANFDQSTDRIRSACATSNSNIQHIVEKDIHDFILLMKTDNEATSKSIGEVVEDLSLWVGYLEKSTQDTDDLLKALKGDKAKIDSIDLDENKRVSVGEYIFALTVLMDRLNTIIYQTMYLDLRNSAFAVLLERNSSDVEKANISIQNKLNDQKKKLQTILGEHLVNEKIGNE